VSGGFDQTVEIEGLRCATDGLYSVRSAEDAELFGVYLRGAEGLAEHQQDHVSLVEAVLHAERLANERGCAIRVGRGLCHLAAPKEPAVEVRPIRHAGDTLAIAIYPTVVEGGRLARIVASSASYTPLIPA